MKEDVSVRLKRPIKKRRKSSQKAKRSGPKEEKIYISDFHCNRGQGKWKAGILLKEKGGPIGKEKSIPASPVGGGKENVTVGSTKKESTEEVDYRIKLPQATREKKKKKD